MPRLILASKGRITNPFGALNPPTAALKYHQGVDTGHGQGTDIYAPAAGAASKHDAGTRLGTYGKYWRIRHDDGTESLVAHLASHVGGNRRVEQGEVIGRMGNTGTISVHCHQEYIVGGVRVDPTKYLAGTAGVDTQPIPIEEEDDMPIEYKIVIGPDNTAWFCWDRILRYPIPGDPNNTYLEDCKAFIRTKGQDPTPVKQGNMNAWGAPVYPDILPRVRQIVAEEVARIPAGTGGVSQAALDALGDRVVAAIPTAMQNGDAARAAIVK